MLPTLALISATLFALVSWFCKTNGLFDMPVPFLAMGLYAIFWFGGTCVACLAYVLTEL